MSTRFILSILLILWLLLSISRLIFDLIGKLWIAAIFDLLQIVFCINGLFGSLQKRRFLLIGLLISNILSIIENILIFLWYIGIFGEIFRPVLSAGLPYSFSFFLRFTPYCQSHFDLKRTIWVQHNCLIPFYTIEASQAIIHIFLAIATTFCTIFVLFEIKKKSVHINSQTINHYAQICATKNQSNIISGINPSMNDTSSGYVNSIYDDMKSQSSAKKNEKRLNGQFERRKKGKKSRPNSMPAPDCPPCSSSKSSEEENLEDFYTKPIKRNISQVGIKLQSNPEIENDSTRKQNVTSLVSFDPKSATLLRIRQHLDAESDNRQSPDSDGLYERLRSRSSEISSNSINNIEPTLSSVQLSDFKTRNSSQDSVPSIFAPILVPNSPSTSSVSSPTIREVGIPLSNHGVMSPGIRLTDQLGSSKKSNTEYKSAFRVQAKEPNRIIGHYHSPNEIPLSSDPKIRTIIHSNYPVITSNGLLV